ncbi:hypothetical protein ABWI01_12010 [Oceanicaulis alexandrii]|uniref:hypothetical protein n=1 Tax=Oceanicaulis alexandrii TaxID=153233 RepID=UPI0035CEEAEE
MINDIKALLVQERNEYVKKDVDILDKISNIDIDYTKSPKVMSAMHSLRTLQADSIWGYAAILFEYALPVALGFILGVYLAFQLF